MALKSLQSYMFAFEDTRSASHRKIPSLYLDRRQNLTFFTCRGRKRLYLICNETCTYQKCHTGRLSSVCRDVFMSCGQMGTDVESSDSLKHAAYLKSPKP